MPLITILDSKSCVSLIYSSRNSNRTRQKTFTFVCKHCINCVQQFSPSGQYASLLYSENKARKFQVGQDWACLQQKLERTLCLKREASQQLVNCGLMSLFPSLRPVFQVLTFCVLPFQPPFEQPDKSPVATSTFMSSERLCLGGETKGDRSLFSEKDATFRGFFCSKHTAYLIRLAPPDHLGIIVLN